MAKDKLFSDLEKQTKIQRYDRKLNCSKETEMKKDLLKYNYFNIINAFEDILLDDLNNKSYKNKHFNDYKRLYELDRSIAKILFGNLLKIENELMTTISYFFCEKNCNAGNSSLLNYLDISYYHGSTTSGANSKDINIFNNHMLFKRNHRIDIICNNITFTGNVSRNTNPRYPNEILLDGSFKGGFKGVSNNEYHGVMTVQQSDVANLSLGTVNNFILPNGLRGSLMCFKYSDYCKIKYPYISKYKSPPMWIIINTLTIKQLYYLYIGLDESIKTKVIKAVSSDNFFVNGSMNKEAFLNAFELIAEVRNQVFHGNNISLIRSPSNLAINSVLINKLGLKPMSGNSYEIRIMDIIKIFNLFDSFNSSEIKWLVKFYLIRNKLFLKNDINIKLIKRIGKLD